MVNVVCPNRPLFTWVLCTWKCVLWNVSTRTSLFCDLYRHVPCQYKSVLIINCATTQTLVSYIFNKYGIKCFTLSKYEYYTKENILCFLVSHATKNNGILSLSRTVECQIMSVFQILLVIVNIHSHPNPFTQHRTLLTPHLYVLTNYRTSMCLETPVINFWSIIQYSEITIKCNYLYFPKYNCYSGVSQEKRYFR